MILQQKGYVHQTIIRDFFTIFWQVLNILQASPQSHRENWHVDEAATDSIVRTKSVLRIRTF